MMNERLALDQQGHITVNKAASAPARLIDDPCFEFLWQHLSLCHSGYLHYLPPPTQPPPTLSHLPYQKHWDRHSPCFTFSPLLPNSPESGQPKPASLSFPHMAHLDQGAVPKRNSFVKLFTCSRNATGGLTLSALWLR